MKTTQETRMGQKAKAWVWGLTLAGTVAATLATGCAGPRPEPGPLTGVKYAARAEIALWGYGPDRREGVQGTRPRGTIFTVIGRDKKGQVWGNTAGVPVPVRMPSVPDKGESRQWKRITR